MRGTVPGTCLPQRPEREAWVPPGRGAPRPDPSARWVAAVWADPASVRGGREPGRRLRRVRKRPAAGRPGPTEVGGSQSSAPREAGDCALSGPWSGTGDTEGPSLQPLEDVLTSGFRDTEAPEPPRHGVVRPFIPPSLRKLEGNPNKQKNVRRTQVVSFIFHFLSQHGFFDIPGKCRSRRSKGVETRSCRRHPNPRVLWARGNRAASAGLTQLCP